MAMMELNLNPSRRELRQFAVISLFGFALIGLVLWWRFEARTAATVLWTLAPLVGVVGLVVPPAIKPLYVGMMVAGYPIGFVVSHVVLGITFYLVFTTIALIFRLIGRDPLHRTFDPAAETYWITRKPTTDARRYFRQF